MYVYIYTTTVRGLVESPINRSMDPHKTTAIRPSGPFPQHLSFGCFWVPGLDASNVSNVKAHQQSCLRLGPKKMMGVGVLFKGPKICSRSQKFSAGRARVFQWGVVAHWYLFFWQSCGFKATSTPTG